jgi:cell division protease FtsH
MTQEELQDKMVVLLGGRAAEQIVFGRYSTGASDDLAKVTDIARSMVMHYGMYKPLGQVVFEPQHPTFLQSPIPIPKERNYSEETAKEIDHAIRDIVDDAYKKSIVIIKAHQDKLEKGAQLLLEQETLNEEDLEKLMKLKAKRT